MSEVSGFRCRVLVAKHMGVGKCETPECGCRSVFVQLLDVDETVFAVGPLQPEDALAYADHLRRVALEMLGGVQ